jgi:hypothetical protein
MMRKNILIACVLVLTLGVWAAPQVYASNITIFDTVTAGTSPNWYNQGSKPGEDQEVEPNCVTGQVWDLEAFGYKNKKLTVISGFDLQNGYGGYNTGDIFVAVNQLPIYGTAALGSGYGGGTITNTLTIIMS